MSKKKDDLPSMPFYFGDWRKAPEVRAMDLETRMVWFEMLGFMWESTDRGYLTLKGKPIENAMLARMIGITEERLTFHLTLMETLDVFSRREEDGAIFNRKMVKDSETRQKRILGGHLGGNPALLKKKEEVKVKDKDNLNGYPLSENENENEKSIKRKAESEQWEKFTTWAEATAPRVMKMKKPLTSESFDKLLKDFTKEFKTEKRAKEVIMDLLTKMHNWEPLIKKNVDTNLTIRNWYNMHKADYHKAPTPPVKGGGAGTGIELTPLKNAKFEEHG